MAIFGKKKEQDAAAGDDAEQVVVNSADPDKTPFTPQPDRARTFFDHAQTVADTGNYEYAITLFANGIKHDPEGMSAHNRMYEAAIRLHSKGSKPASGKEVKKFEGPHPVDRFAAAEFAWMRNLTSASLAIKLIQAAAKADMTEFGRWFAPKLLNVLAKQKKPSKREFLAAMEELRTVGAWDEALKAGAKALEIDPTDAGLAAELKNISAQRAMEQGGYSDVAGEEGGFRKFIRDGDANDPTDTLSGAGNAEERALAKAKRAYEEKPTAAEAVKQYASLLTRNGDPEQEAHAKKIYLKAFQDTAEYHFKMAAADLTIRQGERRVSELQALVDAAPDDTELADQLDSAKRELMMYKSSEYAERSAKYPSNRSYKYQLGLIEFELGNYDNAMGAFQQSKDEPKLRVSSGHHLGLCFAREGWHKEAISEFKEALEAIDATSRDRELDIRYDLMVSLMVQAKEEQSLDLSKEALDICSSIARKDITYRDIRARRKEIDELTKELSA